MDDETKLILDWQVKRNSYWSALRRAHAEFHKQHQGQSEPESESFIRWMLNSCGVKVLYNGPGISGDYEIVDEKKYLLFLMKYKT